VRNDKIIIALSTNHADRTIVEPSFQINELFVACYANIFSLTQGAFHFSGVEIRVTSAQPYNDTNYKCNDTLSCHGEFRWTW